VLNIIDPRQEAQALAWHLGRERNVKRPPLVPALEAAAEVRTAELEYVMQEVPSASR